MEKKDKAASALLAVFPIHETFAGFSENSGNMKAVQSFIDYAARNGIIETNDNRDLEAFTRHNERSPRDCMPPDHLTFEELFERKICSN